MNIQERLREKLYPYVSQWKRNKQSIGVLFVLCGIAIGWGIFHTREDDYVKMAPDSTAMSKSEDKSHEITLLYSTSNNLRALPWHEVLGESLDKSNISSIHMMDEEHSGEGQQNLDNKDDSSKVKQGKRRHSKKIVDQDSSSSAETVTTKHNKQKTIHVNGVIHGPQWAVILSSGTESTVVMEGDSWHGVKVINVDENGVTLDEGGNVRCVSIGES
mgnify:FL=1